MKNQLQQEHQEIKRWQLQNGKQKLLGSVIASLWEPNIVKSHSTEEVKN